MRRIALLTSVLAIHGCQQGDESSGSSESGSAKPEPRPKPTVAPIPVGNHVRVRAGASLHANSDLSVTVATLTRDPESKFPRNPVRGLTPPAASVEMEVIEVDGDALRVRTLSFEEGELACGDQPSGFASVKIEAWIRRDDLVQVLRRPVEIQHDDETGVKLNVGVAVGAEGPEGIRLAHAGVPVFANVEGPVIGDHWKPEPGGPITGKRQLGNYLGTYGGGLALEGEAGFRQLEEKPRDDNSVFRTVANACGTFKLIDSAEAEPERPSGLYAMKGPKDAIPQMARNFDPDMQARKAGILGVMSQQSGHFLASPYGGAFAVGGDDEDVWGGLTGCSPQPDQHIVATNTAVTWMDGTPAGVTLGDVKLKSAPRDGLHGRCFSVVGIENDVCVVAESVTVVPGKTCDGELGSTGLIGEGSGYGRTGSSGSKGGRVRQAKAKVQGALDKDIIRRIVRAHINEVRSCYNKGLEKDPDLQGRVAINFVITTTGKVGSSVVQESSLKDKVTSNCIAKAVKRWKFPKPRGGGNVIVTYPFNLSPK